MIVADGLAGRFGRVQIVERRMMAPVQQIKSILMRRIEDETD